MIIRPQGMRLEIRSPAKINLTLELLGKRPDGFHELETVMKTVNLCDQIMFSPRFDSQINLQLDSPSADSNIPTDSRNLVVQALELVRQEAQIDLGMEVLLKKNIPSEAGLGGASGNAAAALLAANKIWNLGWSLDRLSTIGGKIGSDVPFFLTGGTALCRGRGELIEPIDCPAHLFVVIAKPPVGLSTKRVYSNAKIPPEPKRAQSLCDSIVSGNVWEIGNVMFNRLQEFASPMCDWIVSLESEFCRLGCVAHQLSGSGTSYFGIFPTRQASQKASQCLSNRLPRVKVFCTHTLGQVQVTDPRLALAG